MSTQTFTLSQIYDPIRADLSEVEHIFDREIQSEFAFINDLCVTVRSYRGKMLRPALLLLSARACGAITRTHHVLGAVIEMVHMATLVHDDVLDGAAERRRKPTVCSLSGNVAAVLLGDFLISHAFHLCSSLKDQHASRRIGDTTNVVCEGELLQNRYRGDWALTEEQYFGIIRRKTAVLTATACELGAYYSGASREVVNDLHEYGLSAGIAFQVVDDVLDILGDPEEVGKTLGSDSRLGKLTLPTIKARAGMSNGFDPTVVIDSDRFREWVTNQGGVEYALNMAGAYVSSAIKRLEGLRPSEARSALAELAEFIIRRRF